MRIVLARVGAALIVAAALAGGVLAANATVFSASAFVRGYLAAVAAGHVDEVLALPGVDTQGLDPRLLDARAYSGLDTEVLADELREGVHHVRVGIDDGGTREELVFEVEQRGTRFGLFPRWGFAVSPVTALEVTTTGDARFRAGELPLAAADGGPVVFAAITPARYVFGHESAFLTAEPVEVVTTGADRGVRLDIRPNAAFVAAVRAAVESELDACAEQRVLFPTGCPFGFAIANRVASEPRWTITELADAEVAPGDRVGVWTVPAVEGVARLQVEVQSLFDGTVSTLEEDVPFTAGYDIAFEGSSVALSPIAP